MQTQAASAIVTYRHTLGGFATHAKRLGATQDHMVEDGMIAYHFADGSTALTKGRGKAFQLWESSSGAPEVDDV